MKQISKPIAVAIAVCAILLLVFVAYRTTRASASDSGDVSGITSEILKNNPKDAPQMPASMNPANRAMGAGKGQSRQ